MTLARRVLVAVAAGFLLSLPATAAHAVIPAECDPELTECPVELVAPTGLTVGTVTATTVDLSWDAAGATAHYTVTGGPEDVDVTDGTSTTLTDLTPATTYTFAVTATDGTITTDPSASVNVTTLAAPAATPPADDAEAPLTNGTYTVGTNVVVDRLDYYGNSLLFMGALGLMTVTCYVGYHFRKGAGLR